MLKGVQKNMIFIQLPKEKCFESAYFVIRSRSGDKEARRGEMVKEANRIVGEMLPESEEKRERGSRRSRGKAAFFVYGILSGMSAVAIAWLVTLILT